MKLRTILLLSAVFMSQAFADPHPGDEGARNKDGSVVTGVLTAQFNPSAGILPFPTNLFFVLLPTDDLTINIPLADPGDGTNPLVALNSLDGFSTTEKWVATFVDNDGNPGSIDPLSVVPGQSVRVFQVTSPPPYVAVTGIVRELTPGLEYFAAAAPGGVLAIVPIVPLPEFSTFMAVLTNDIRDAAGNDATPDQTYFLTKRRTSWVDDNNQSVNPLLDDATARALEPLRLITLSMEFAAANDAGIDPDDIILAWTVQTQSITPVLKAVRSIAEPGQVLAGQTPFNTSLVGPFGFADIIVGVITVPYYLSAPSAANPIAPLTEPWRAVPGGYVPPFDQAGLNPTSTNLTFYNRFPVPTGTETVPFILTVPNAASGHAEKPAGGWPVVIFQHGIQRNRTDMLAIADAMASQGFAVIAMDQPLHGVVPAVEPRLAPFYIGNHPVFGGLAHERTFDADYWDNVTGEFKPAGDGIPDPSGASAFNLLNLQVARDNLRQAVADLSVLALSLQDISYDGDSIPDLNPFNVGVIAHSFGTATGVPFMAIEADSSVSRAYLNVGTGALMRTAIAGEFGARIKAALAAVGVIEGTVQYEQFLTVAQTLLDSGDGINWAKEAAGKLPIIHNQVQGDTVVVNSVLGAPLVGNEALNLALGLQPYSMTTVNMNGIRGVARFLYGEHSALLLPTFPEITAEMQGQAASFMLTGGNLVQVANPDVLVPVVASGVRAPVAPGDGQAGRKKKKPGWGGESSLDRLAQSDENISGRQ